MALSWTSAFQVLLRRGCSAPSLVATACPCKAAKVALFRTHRVQELCSAGAANDVSFPSAGFWQLRRLSAFQRDFVDHLRVGVNGPLCCDSWFKLTLDRYRQIVERDLSFPDQAVRVVR